MRHQEDQSLGQTQEAEMAAVADQDGHHHHHLHHHLGDPAGQCHHHLEALGGHRTLHHGGGRLVGQVEVDREVQEAQEAPEVLEDREEEEDQAEEEEDHTRDG